MSKTILISISDIRNGLKETLAEYWKRNGFIQPVSLVVGPNGKSIFVVGNMEPCDMVINMIFHELVTERPSDMRNAGQLFMTEKLLTDHSIDERTAHAIAEDVFANLVNMLGEHLPHLPFGGPNDFQYTIRGGELWLTPAVI